MSIVNSRSKFPSLFEKVKRKALVYSIHVVYILNFAGVCPKAWPREFGRDERHLDGGRRRDQAN